MNKVLLSMTFPYSLRVSLRTARWHSKRWGVIIDRASPRTGPSAQSSLPDVNPPARSCGGYLFKCLVPPPPPTHLFPRGVPPPSFLSPPQTSTPNTRSPAPLHPS